MMRRSIFELSCPDAAAVVVLADRGGNVVTVAVDVPKMRDSLLAAHPGAVAITGEPARLIYRALAGRDFLTQSPEESTAGTALDARHLVVARWSRHTPGYELGMAIVARNFDRVMPYLGTTLLDDAGHIVETPYMYALDLVLEEAMTL